MKRILMLLIMVAGLHCAVAAVFEGRVFLDANRNGEYDAGEAGMADIVVSDSDNVVKTDANGWFKLESRAKKPLLWIMRPSQHEPTTPFWMHGREGVIHEFGLAPQPQKKDFMFFHITDTHINKSALMKEVVAQINSLPLEDVAFVVHTGDLVLGSDTKTIFNAFKQYDSYLIGEYGLKYPIFYVCGNHELANTRHAVRHPDHDFYEKGIFRHRYGPTVYSFDWADVHFIALDGQQVQPEGAYTYYNDDIQLGWLEKDLALLPEGKPIVIFQHEILSKNLDKYLEGKNVIAAFGGHSHRTWTRAFKGFTNYIVAAVCGGWWGMQNRDGRPQGFQLTSIKDNKLENFVFLNRKGHNAISNFTPLGNNILKGEQEFVFSVLDYGKPLEIAAELDGKPFALEKKSQERLWSYWSGKLDTATLFDGVHDFHLTAKQDGQESDYTVRYLILNGKPNESPVTQQEGFAMTLRVVKCDFDAEVQINHTPIGKILKGGEPVVTWKPETYHVEKEYGKKKDLMRFEIDPSLVKKMNRLSIVNTSAEPINGVVDLEVIHLNYPDKEGKNKALKDIRFYNNQTFRVKGKVPGHGIHMHIMFE